MPEVLDVGVACWVKGTSRRKVLQSGLSQRASPATMLDQREKNGVLEDLGCVHSPWAPKFSDVCRNGFNPALFCMFCQRRLRNKPGLPDLCRGCGAKRACIVFPQSLP